MCEGGGQCVVGFERTKKAVNLNWFGIFLERVFFSLSEKHLGVNFLFLYFPSTEPQFNFLYINFHNLKLCKYLTQNSDNYYFVA